VFWKTGSSSTMTVDWGTW